MQCPACNVPLKKGDRVGVPLQFCDRCGGAWVDLYNLDMMLFRTQPEGTADREEDGSDLETVPRLEPRRR
jgi:Zn-finger nucleic acid-binding protein